LQVQIQGHSLKFLIYLLPVLGADLVLGAAWLVTLGPHIFDYSTMILKFLMDGNFITLYGVKPKLPTLAQYNHLRQMQRTHAVAEIFTLQFQQLDGEND